MTEVLHVSIVSRWPRTLAGVTASRPCLPFSLSLMSLLKGPDEPRVWRRCGPEGHWDKADVSECPPAQEVMQVLLTFATVGEPTLLSQGLPMCMLCDWWPEAECQAGWASPWSHFWTQVPWG